jgi:hypothetical protein
MKLKRVVRETENRFLCCPYEDVFLDEFKQKIISRFSETTVFHGVNSMSYMHW